MKGETLNVIFVCSRNKWRSPTAEAIYRRFPGVNARSAGTSASARVQVNDRLISWADIIFVMETRHRQILEQRFSARLSATKIVCLDITDDYQFMDEELVTTIKDRVREYLPVPE